MVQASETKKPNPAGGSKAGMWTRWKQRVAALKIETYALYLAARDPRVPWYAKVLAASVAAYLLSPIDLIPDVIPVLGALDDLILVPLGIWLALRMIPDPVLQTCRMQAHKAMAGNRPVVSRTAGVVVIALWILAVIWLAWLVFG
ncbi:MAG: DUF1232 domain-containing protein [Desulfobacterales bacterium]|nr:DUF1232 domain-containing protein [Desulfobacterales bacterium]